MLNRDTEGGRNDYISVLKLAIKACLSFLLSFFLSKGSLASIYDTTDSCFDDLAIFEYT